MSRQLRSLCPECLCFVAALSYTLRVGNVQGASSRPRPCHSSSAHLQLRCFCLFVCLFETGFVMQPGLASNSESSLPSWVLGSRVCSTMPGHTGKKTSAVFFPLRQPPLLTIQLPLSEHLLCAQHFPSALFQMRK